MFLLSLSAQGQRKDTLPGVKVVAVPVSANAKTVVPVQQLRKEELLVLNSLSVADAVKYFAGALVKDYGGIGGLKTVSVRSLGANHTGVAYDGIIMSDAMGGQIDLGKLSLDNIGSISLYNSGPGIFLPARCFAYGSLLQLLHEADKDAVQKVKYKASLKGGSFGFINPSVKVTYKWNKHLYTAINAEWQKAGGEYPYSAYEQNGEKPKRNNSDIKADRAEFDTRYMWNDSNRISLKIYYYNSERGLPGAVILNNNAISHERLWDKNFFVQGSWLKTFSAKHKLLLSVKYNYLYNHYLNPDFLNVQGKLESIFNQKEMYQSAVYAYKPFSFLSLSYASDYFINKLQRTDEFFVNFSEPTRVTWLNNVAAHFATKRVEAEANMLSSSTREQTKQGPAGKNYDKLTSAIAVSWQPRQAFPVRVRAFYKSIFRLPTFNDLYYTFLGNTSLKPEFAKQYNLGLTWQQNTRGIVQAVVITADGYINEVTDKIVAVPRENLFQWSMQNIGKVNIKGVDAGLTIVSRQLNKTRLTFRGAYTYQYAVDITNETSVLYKNQIPYTPLHSGSASLHAAYKKLSAGYNVLLSGLRYKTGENNSYNLVEGYAIHDFTIIWHSSLKAVEYRITAELNNVFNKQYDVIQYYPMPGRNYRVGIILNNK